MEFGFNTSVTTGYQSKLTHMAEDQADHGKHAEIQLRTVVKVVCINTGWGGGSLKQGPNPEARKTESGVGLFVANPLLTS